MTEAHQPTPPVHSLSTPIPPIHPLSTPIPIMNGLPSSHVSADSPNHLKPDQMSILQFLLYLKTRWVTGPSSLSSVQQEKGKKILEALIHRASVADVQRLNSASDESATCEFLGSAQDYRAGEDPSTYLLLQDINGSEEGSIRFSDSSTGEFDPNIQWYDFVHQNWSLARQTPLRDSDRIFAALEIPSTPNGFNKCRYTSLPYSRARDSMVAALTTAWTLAGYITLPHMDTLATALILFHWFGDKLWVLFPATELNLKIMGEYELNSPNLDGTLKLVGMLEGLEIMFLTERNHHELLFLLKPNTIHMCLSFTESCHSGAFVHSHKFLPQVKAIVDWRLRWIKKEMDGPYIDKEFKKNIIQDAVDAIAGWDTLGKKKDLCSGQRREIRDMVKGMKAALEFLSSKYGIVI
ncbi:hypothetical protein MD484_g8590, partial [Candolleomyces efflorescens]